jgi:hypothetical protein
MVYTLVVHLYAKDDQECINKLIAKLQEASQVYTNDKECLGWYVLFQPFCFRIPFSNVFEKVTKEEKSQEKLIDVDIGSSCKIQRTPAPLPLSRDMPMRA